MGKSYSQLKYWKQYLVVSTKKKKNGHLACIPHDWPDVFGVLCKTSVGVLSDTIYSALFECMSLVITIIWKLSQIVLNNICTIIEISKNTLAFSQRDRMRKGDLGF